MFEKEAEEFERRKHYRYEDNDYCGDIADGIIQAYQQGAEFGFNKANEWHDLRKNPDDLPKHSGLYCVQCGEVREYVKEERSWFTVNFDPCMNRTEETYLWCDIPKFKELI